MQQMVFQHVQPVRNTPHPGMPPQGATAFCLQACAAPSELLPAIKAMDASKFSKYKHGSPAGIIKHLDQLMGLA